MQSYLRAVVGCGLALSLVTSSACGRHTGSLGEPPVLSGQIDGWNKGTGFTLEAYVTGKGSSPSELASAAIDASGKFSITLPNAAAVAPYLYAQHIDSNQADGSCKWTNHQSSSADFANALVDLRAVSGSTTFSVAQTVTSPVSGVVVYVYMDHDLTESGQQTCMFGTATTQYGVDLSFASGWNHVTVLEMSSSSHETNCGADPG